MSKNLVKQRCPQMFVAVNLGARGDNHILRHPQSAQTTVRALRAADGLLIAVGNDNEQINVAVVMRRAPGVRAEQPDLLRLKFRHELLRGRLKQIFVERFHGLFLLFLINPLLDLSSSFRRIPHCHRAG